MTIQKYNINNIFKLILIFGIIFGANNSVLADIDRNNTQEESPVKAPGLADVEKEPASEGNSAQQKPSDTKTNPDDGESDRGSKKKQSQSSNTEIPASQEFLTLKNILLLFAIIDLPVIALLLTLWFLDRKEQKQKFDNLVSKQNIIDRKLKQLETITLKLENSDKFSNKIVKEIENNKQEIINSRIELRTAFEKKQSERLNSNGRTDIYSNNSHNFSTFTKEQTESQLDKLSHNPVAVIEQIPQFVDKYNLDKKSLSEGVIATVVATQASLDDKRLGKIDKLTLESTAQKKYLVVQEDSDFYLVPHAKINIEEHNIKTLESLFECINFSSDYTDFHLIQPAKVSQVEPELWQLDKKGKLEFS